LSNTLIVARKALIPSTYSRKVLQPTQVAFKLRKMIDDVTVMRRYFSRATTKSGTQSRARLNSESGSPARAWRLCSA